MKRRRIEPEFPPDLMTADEAIALVVDAILLGSPPLRKLTKKILRAENELREVADERAWKAYLVLEERKNERDGVQIDLLMRWALGAGARSRR